MKDSVISDILAHKIIVILRGLTERELIATVSAMEKGGIRFAEVTFDGAGVTTAAETAACIRALRTAFEGRVHIGAGTVLTPDQVDLAYAAGAEFIISPNTDPDVIARTVALGMVSIPGALTPTEALLAHKSGADFVKLFPAGDMGPSYLKSVATPLSFIRFLAVAGVTFDNARAFLQNGACGLGISSLIAGPALVHSGDFDKITDTCRRLVALTQ